MKPTVFELLFLAILATIALGVVVVALQADDRQQVMRVR